MRILQAGVAGVFLWAVSVDAVFDVEPLGLGQVVSEFSLDGCWKFIPADAGVYAAGSGDAALVDAMAHRIQQADLSSWHDLETPQFLNESIWWVSQSDRFMVNEKARMDAMPFDARNTWSGWYVREIRLPSIEGVPPEVRINFEGIAMVSRVYCNGEQVGGHLGMFGEVDCRLTPLLKWGETNRIAVYVRRGSNIESDENKVLGVAVTVPVTSGMLNSLNHGMFGGFGRESQTKFMGIWQPVKLRIAPGPARIADVFFKPQLDRHKLEVTLENPGRERVSGEVRYSLKDARTGEVLVEAGSVESLVLEPGETRKLEFSETGLTPKLWSPDFPNLYALGVQWIADGRINDEYACRVGYRTVETKGKRVYLNGHPYWVRGANHPPYGLRPTEPDVARRFLELMREGNTMVTRTHCNPWNRMWYELADEIGIGNTTEGVRPWALMGSSPPPAKALLEHWKAEQLETVRQYRNHPSILFYCIANEGTQADYKNKIKTDIYKDIMAAMRELDDTRPIFQTSGEWDWHNDADLEDIHGYFGWYQPSAFILDFRKEGPSGLPSADRPRPFINQECAVGYNNTDTGGPMTSYIGKGMTEPWIGCLTDRSVDGGTQAVPAFKDHQMRNAKRTAEEYRWSRRELESAGLMLFANSTWITHVTSHAPEEWNPAPVWDGVRTAYEPVLVAFESPQYSFRSGQDVETKIRVVNDDTRFRDFQGVQFESTLVDGHGKTRAKYEQELGAVAYYEVKDYPFSARIPEMDTGGKMVPMQWELRLYDGAGEEIARNTYPVFIADEEWMTGPRTSGLRIGYAGVSAEVAEHLGKLGEALLIEEIAKKADVIVVGRSAAPNSLEPLKKKLAVGGRIVLLGQGEDIQRLCPEAFQTEAVPVTRKLAGEYVWMQGRADFNTPLIDGLEWQDWKWWMNGSDKPAVVCDAGHRIDTENEYVIPIGRYLGPHFYWSGSVPDNWLEQISWPVFAVQYDWGEVLVSELAIEAALPYDPRAVRTLSNFVKQPLGVAPRLP